METNPNNNKNENQEQPNLNNATENGNKEQPNLNHATENGNKEQSNPNNTTETGNKHEPHQHSGSQDPNRKDGVFRITGDWAVQSKKLQEKFTDLTESDLKFEPGKEHELLNRVETRLNKKRNEVIDILKNNQSEKV